MLFSYIDFYVSISVLTYIFMLQKKVSIDPILLIHSRSWGELSIDSSY